MTEKQMLFCNEYLIDMNGTRAYKAAYPKVKNDNVAAVNSHQLLRKTKIQEYINKQLEKIHNKKTADAQEVIEYLTSVIRGEEVEQVPTKTGGITEIVVTPKDRLRAAELLGKRYGIYLDKVETKVEVSDKFSDIMLQLKNNKTLE